MKDDVDFHVGSREHTLDGANGLTVLWWNTSY